MKKAKLILLTFTIVMFTSIIFNASAQDLGESVSKKVGVYVFPAKDQTKEQQEKDQSDCYTWAKEQSGVDLLDRRKVKKEQVPTGPDPSVVHSAGKGAVAGTAIGAIAGDSGKGAAIGAIAGAAKGRRTSKANQAAAQENANQKASNTEKGLMDNFKKAYTACLEGKGYTVK